MINEGEWFSWRTFYDADSLKTLGLVPEVYAIRLLDTSTKKPLRIGRFLGRDEQGILQIGVSKRLGKRLLDFFHSCYEGAHTHSEGARLCLVRLLTQFEEHIYPEASLQYNMIWTSDIEDAKRDEERLLKIYFKRFGELPPLNNNISNQRIRWAEADAEWDTIW